MKTENNKQQPEETRFKLSLGLYTVTTLQHKKQKQATDTFSSSSFLTVFPPLVLHLARVRVTNGSMRGYMDLLEAAQ